MNTSGQGRGAADGMCREVLAAVVLIPRDFVVTRRRGEDVGVTVTVHVYRKHALGKVCGGDGVGGEVLAAIVFVPRNLVVKRGCGQDVGIAIAVQVCRKYALGRI